MEGTSVKFAEVPANHRVSVNVLKGWAALQKDLNRQGSCAISDVRGFQDRTEKSLEQSVLNSMLTFPEGGSTREVPDRLSDSETEIPHISYSHGLTTRKICSSYDWQWRKKKSMLH